MNNIKIFISYKSEDVNLVRLVAERLIESGINIWFAEYSILLDNYEQFQEEIERGISSATHAILFTNRRWVKSDHCKIEMALIMKYKIDFHNILVVKVPLENEEEHYKDILSPHEEYPQLASINPIYYQGISDKPDEQNIVKLMMQIAQRFNISDLNIAASRPLSIMNHVHFSRFGLSFDAGPLVIHPIVTEKVRLVAKKVRRNSIHNAVCFRGNIRETEVTLWFFASPLGSPINNTVEAERIAISQNGNCDDRAIYIAYRKVAKEWVDNENIGATRATDLATSIHVEGLHLFFVDGKSQMALTVKEKTDNIELYERRYVVVVSDRVYQNRPQIGEIRLQFSANVSPYSPTEQYSKFIGLCSYLDSIAGSVRYTFPTRFESFFNNLPILISKVIILFFLIFFSINIPLIRKSPWLTTAAFAIIGMLTADIILFLRNPYYRRLLWLRQPLLEDTFRVGSLKRVSSELSYWSFNSLSFIHAHLLYALKQKSPQVVLLVIALILIAIGMPIDEVSFHPIQIACSAGSIIVGAILSHIGIVSYVHIMIEE